MQDTEAPLQAMVTPAVIQHYRDGPHDALLQELERGMTEWGESYDVAAQFNDAVSALKRAHDKRRLTALVEKSRREPWSAEDKALYRDLQRALGGVPGAGMDAPRHE